MMLYIFGIQANLYNHTVEGAKFDISTRLRRFLYKKKVNKENKVRSDV